MKLFYLSIIVILLSTQAFANDEHENGLYKFNGQVIKLDKFIDHKNVDVDETLDKNNIPPKVDLTRYQSPVKNQSDRGACAYFSSTALLESEIKKKTGVEINISEEYLIWYTKAILRQSTRDDGSFSGSNLRALGESFLLEKHAPYQPSWFGKGLPCEQYKDAGRMAPATCYSHKKPYNADMNLVKVNGLNVQSLYFSLQEVIDALASGKSVITNLPVNQNAWDAKTGFADYNEKYRKECQEKEDLCGGHSIVLTGYDLEKEVFYFKNSWGVEWGKKGYGYLPFNYVRNYNQGNMYIVIGDLALPRDATAEPKAEASNVNYTLDTITNEQITTKVGADVSYTKNAMFYISTFLATKNDLGSYDYLEVPKNLQDKYGVTVRGYFYKNFKTSDSLSFDINASPAINKIPLQVINRSNIEGKELFARVSLYVYTDDEGWRKIFREFKPIELN